MSNPNFDTWRVICTGGSGFIGSHFCSLLIKRNVDFLNLDIKSPSIASQEKYWRKLDILDYKRLDHLISEYRPTHVVHLAAKTDMNGTSIEDFQVNTVGTENLLSCVDRTTSVKRLVITSSQHVIRPANYAKNSKKEYDPYGLYGKSKVATEIATKKFDPNCCWTIVRPTNIWGARHPSYSQGLWKWMKLGIYWHPKDDHVTRSYGYVKNITWQLEKILLAPTSLVDKDTFYLGERIMFQKEWVSKFYSVLTGGKLRLLPSAVFRGLAIVGDFLLLIGVKFPVTSERYRNLSTNNNVPIERTLDVFGIPPYTLEQGIEETVDWLREHDAFWQ